MDERLKVLDELRTFNASTVARKYNVHPTTISRIKHSAPKVMEFIDKGKAQQSRRRIRPSTFDPLEQNLLAWLIERKLVGDNITNGVLLRKATELRDSMELLSNFKVSRGWLDGFKKRYDVQIVKEPGKRPNADRGSAKKFCDNSATGKDSNNLTGDPDTGEDMVHLTSSCEEEIKSETTEEVDERVQEHEEAQECIEAQGSIALQEGTDMQERTVVPESTEMQESTEVQESKEVQESIEVEESKIVPESTEMQRSTEAQESKRVELLYLFQRLEQHVAQEEPFIQNIFQIFKNHFLGNISYKYNYIIL